MPIRHRHLSDQDLISDSSSEDLVHLVDNSGRVNSCDSICSDVLCNNGVVKNQANNCSHAGAQVSTQKEASNSKKSSKYRKSTLIKRLSDIARGRYNNEIISNRLIFDQEDFDKTFDAQKPLRFSHRDAINKLCHRRNDDDGCCKIGYWRSTVLNLLPFIEIMRAYKWKRDVINDLVSGLTIGIMNIPQGMAYALLAEMKPVYGLYVSFLPAVIYFFLGTSRQISIGTFALASLMIAAPINRLVGDSPDTISNEFKMSIGMDPNSMLMNSSSVWNFSERSCYLENGTLTVNAARVQVAMAVTLFAGLIQVLMGILRFGFLTIYLSDPMVTGFTTGAAFHVMTSQVPQILGIHVHKQSGSFKLIKIYIQLFENIASVNPVTLIISVVSLTILILFRQLFNPKLRKHCRFPIPVELILVVTGTLVSYLVNFHARFQVTIVGDIPRGFPAPCVPRLSIFRLVVVDAAMIAVVMYVITISLSKIFAKRHKYKLDSNQELLANGAVNVICPFFSCYMSAGSLSRSMVQEEMGGKTQLAGVFSSVLMLIVLLWIGPLFASVPNCILSCIIILALKGLFMQFKELLPLWRISRFDFMIWLVTCIATVLWDVDVGLLLGFVFSLLTIVLRTQLPYSCLLGWIPNTDLYKDITSYSKAVEIPGIKIFRFDGSVYFASSEHFRSNLYNKTGLDPQKMSSLQSSAELHKDDIQCAYTTLQVADVVATLLNPAYVDDCSENSHLLGVEPNDVATEINMINCTPNELQRVAKRNSVVLEQSSSKVAISTIILDCTTWAYMDNVGVAVLTQIIQDYQLVCVDVLLAGCKGTVRNMLERSGFYNQHARSLLFVTVHDAVLYTLKKHPAMLSLDEQDSTRVSTEPSPSNYQGSTANEDLLVFITVEDNESRQRSDSSARHTQPEADASLTSLLNGGHSSSISHGARSII